MVYLAFDTEGKFVGAHVEPEKARDMVGMVGEVMSFERATIYKDLEEE